MERERKKKMRFNCSVAFATHFYPPTFYQFVVVVCFAFSTGLNDANCLKCLLVFIQSL